MEIPKTISKLFNKHQWVPVLIFGILIGFKVAAFQHNRDIEVFETIIKAKNEFINEYRERLQIRSSNEGPYQFYTNLEIRNRVLGVSNQIEMLCEQNPLLSIGEFYLEEYAQCKTNPKEIGLNPFIPGVLLFLFQNQEYMDEVKRITPGPLLFLFQNQEYIDESKPIKPENASNDVVRMLSNPMNEIGKRVSNAIKPELHMYNKHHKKDAIYLKREMLSRMPPRAWRHYRSHADPENPGQFLIGVAIQLKEIANDLTK